MVTFELDPMLENNQTSEPVPTLYQKPETSLEDPIYKLETCNIKYFISFED